MGRNALVPEVLMRRPFSLEEAREAGVSRSALRGKSWRRLATGIYCWNGVGTDPYGLLVAWGNRLPPDAAFAGLTAAWLHGLDVDPCHPIEVIVPTTSDIRSRLDLVVRRGDLSEVTEARALRATTAGRTFRDLSRRLPEVELLVLADAALRLRLGCFHELAQPAESPMETRLRWLLIRSGLPAPAVQEDLHDSDGRFIGRADLYYPSAHLVIEFDGGNHRDRLVSDNRRQNLLVGAGYSVLRFTSADVNGRADAIVTQVRSALASKPL
ncbi:MAG TPA: DUF559 domain-containing protein [Candidatus Dormibacteraeota bacterium]|nr:DUF559 domain-containing protein [Candidatus Dormibacteraeota bacterium]